MSLDAGVFSLGNLLCGRWMKGSLDNLGGVLEFQVSEH